MKFEWDLKKEIQNIKKHGIDFYSAVSSFKDPQGIKLIDKKHSRVETRYYWIGLDDKSRVLTVRFTLRENTIRIFGCAEWRQMKRIYYEKTKNK